MASLDTVRAGKRLAHCLRHSPKSYGVTLREDGSATVTDICEGLGLSFADLEEIVSSDSKGRFMVDDGRIWATQGHSVKVSVPMKLYESSEPLFHGTKRSALSSIMEEGILPGQRTHVHLSLTKETAETVADRRKGDSVILKVDAGRLLASGAELKISDNGVVLAESIPPEFISVI